MSRGARAGVGIAAAVWVGFLLAMVAALWLAVRGLAG